MHEHISYGGKHVRPVRDTRGTLLFALGAILIFTPLARGCVQGWAISVLHLLTLATLAITLCRSSLTWQWSWVTTPLDKPIAVLLLLMTASTLFSLRHETSFWSMVLLLNYVALFYLTQQIIVRRSLLQRLIYIVVGVAVFLAVFGLVKKYGSNPFAWWDYQDLGPRSSSLTSTYGNRNHLAGYLVMAIPLAAGLLITGLKPGRMAFILYLVCLLVTTLILSLSRGAWAGAAIGLIFMAVTLLTNRYYRHKGHLTATIGIFIFLSIVSLTSTPVIDRILSVSEQTDEPSLNARIKVWQATIEMIADHPWHGIGPGMFGTVFTRYQPPGYRVRFFYAHNDYLHFISETGILLIPISIWMIIAIYRKGLKKLKNPSRLVRGTTIGALSGITAILAHSIVDFNLNIPANAVLFTVLVAIAVSPLPQRKYDYRS